ncbi:hypothetical protein NLI96_g9421 [Meripilus lineatus]|uniref:High nitrogen upregulated cytochrome P450 monooxygenase 2 n=1 Tax=Meripilus lineatus TaxID=2056292 RepID=A0AAD5UVH0_9APHY|nr:hypothetical protein NLI96_g9421 [Physisporinus lineatus]
MLTSQLFSVVMGLSLRQVLTSIIGLSGVTYLIFKRYEPANPLVVFTLLVALPSFLSVLLAQHVTPFLLAPGITFATFYVSLISATVLYRLSPFHPLANYPGPLPCKLSMFWMTWVSKSGKRHIYLKKLHDKYGDIVRIGPNEVSIREASAINPLMGTTGLPKGPNWPGRALHPAFSPLIIIQSHDEHSRRRKPWNRAFSTSSLKGYEPVIEKRARQLVEHLSEHKDEVVDLAQWISFFTFDFMGDMAFGGGYELMRDGDKDGLWKVVEDGLSLGIIFEHLPWLSRLVRGLPGVGEDTKRMRSMGIRRAEERMKQGSTVKDLFYYLSNEDGSEKQSPPYAQIVSDGTLAVIAGSDTTASAMCNIFFLLLKHPNVFKRLQDEVDKFYPHGEDALSTKHHHQMPFLDAVINEALRFWPIIMSGSQRAPTRGSGGAALGPFFIPEGNQARIHFFSVLRDPRNFSPFPNSFWPDRWLIVDGLQDLSTSPDTQGYTGEFIHNQAAFIPFSHGPYNCVGKNLALLEMKMVICHLLQNFDIRFDEKWNTDAWERDMLDVFVMKKGKLPVHIALRHPSASL